MNKESWKRVYEGEWIFVCRNNCGGYLIDYSFNAHHDPTHDIADFYEICSDAYAHTTCYNCGGLLKWHGCIPSLTVSSSLKKLYDDKHYMAVTVMVAAVMESYLGNLLYASLVDEGVAVLKAEKIANSRLSRRDSVNMIKDLTEWPVQDICFPIRNMVAHGQRLTNNEKVFIKEINNQIKDITKWYIKLAKNVHCVKFKPNEKERWLLSMNHWINWANDYFIEIKHNE